MRTLADGWTTAPAESMGVDSGKLAALRASVLAWPAANVRDADAWRGSTWRVRVAS